jgi:hypothetical protein
MAALVLATPAAAEQVGEIRTDWTGNDIVIEAIAGVLGLPEALLRYAGLLLIPFVALVAWAWTREQAAAHVVRTIIGANAAWVVASILLLLSGWVQPTALGYGFVIGQAVVVGIFAALQMLGLRRSPAVG